MRQQSAADLGRLDEGQREAPPAGRGSGQLARRDQKALEGESRIFVCPDDPAPVASPGGVPASYGMNNQAFRLTGVQDSGRIVLLDYKTTVANIVGQTIWQLQTAWPAGMAPRHLQSENVTFADGHVQPIDPQLINPVYCVYYNQYWLPQQDTQSMSLAGCLALGTPASGSTSAGITTAGTTTAGTTTAGTTTAGTTTAGTTTAGTTTAGTTTAGTTTGGTTPTLCSLDQTYGFYTDGTLTYSDAPGLVFIRGVANAFGNTSYCITAAGNLVAWVGPAHSNVDSTVIANVGAAVYANPSLLYSAYDNAPGGVCGGATTTGTTTTTTTTTTGTTTTTTTTTTGTTTGTTVTCKTCQNGPPGIPNLLIRYTFNDNPAVAGVPDYSGNNVNGTPQNINWGLAFTKETPPCGAVSMIDKSSQVGFSSSVLTACGQTGQITVAFWFQLTGVTGYINSLVYGTNAGGSRNFNWHLPASYGSTTASLEVMWDCGGNYDRLEEPNNVGCPSHNCGTGLCNGTWPSSCGGDYGNWHHWVATKNVSTGVMQVYRDGVLYNNNAIGGQGPFTNPIDTVANTSLFNDQYLTLGWVHDFQIYNRVLLPSEIQCLATP